MNKEQDIFVCHDLPIFKTTDYSLFKTLQGNREIKDQRVEKIKDSIGKVGYVPNPIIINEKREVIDGQGRLQALKELGLPVYFLSVKGIGIKECIAMNINQKNWQTSDYIFSYVKQGNENYKRLALLSNEFNTLENSVIFAVAKGSNRQWSGGYTTVVQSGQFKLSPERYEKSVKVLEYVSKFIPYIKNKIQGRTTNLYLSIAFCYENVEFDTDRLLKQFSKKYHTIPPISNIKDAMASIERIYNQGLGKNRAYFTAEYDKHKYTKE